MRNEYKLLRQKGIRTLEWSSRGKYTFADAVHIHHGGCRGADQNSRQIGYHPALDTGRKIFRSFRNKDQNDEVQLISAIV